MSDRAGVPDALDWMKDMDGRRAWEVGYETALETLAGSEPAGLREAAQRFLDASELVNNLTIGDGPAYGDGWAAYDDARDALRAALAGSEPAGLRYHGDGDQCLGAECLNTDETTGDHDTDVHSGDWWEGFTEGGRRALAGGEPAGLRDDREDRARAIHDMLVTDFGRCNHDRETMVMWQCRRWADALATPTASPICDCKVALDPNAHSSWCSIHAATPTASPTEDSGE